MVQVFFLGLLKQDNTKLYQESTETWCLFTFVLMKLHLG